MRLSQICIAIAQLARGGAAWSPADLTALAAWYDPSDLSTMFNDSAGTTPVATPGTVADSANPVGLIQDKSGNGHHASQSTSTARPLLSARRNTLTYTEDFSNAVWQLLSGLEKTPNYALAPDGTMTACRLYAPTAGGVLYGHGVFTTDVVRSVWAKSNTGDSYSVTWGSGGTGVVTPTWQRIGGPASGFLYLWHLIIDEAGGDISIWHPQCESGTTATTYQRVTTDADYDGDPAKFPYYLKFDGVDDYLSTAAIDLTGTDKVTVFSGTLESCTSDRILYETSTDAYANTGAFWCCADYHALGVCDWLVRGNGVTEFATVANQPQRAVTTAKLSSAFTNSVGAVAANVNGVAQTLKNTINPSGTSTGNFGNHPLFIGARSGSAYPFTGNLYSLIIGGALYDAATVSEAETWVAEKTGVTL